MGMIGRWIDGLTDEERDAIIEHPDPTYDGEDWWDDIRGCGCLVGCVAASSVNDPRNESVRRVCVSRWPSIRSPMDLQIQRGTEGVDFRFPILTKRFSPERMWRVVKARAAKGNAVDLTANVSPTIASVGSAVEADGGTA